MPRRFDTRNRILTLQILFIPNTPDPSDIKYFQFYINIFIDDNF